MADIRNTRLELCNRIRMEAEHTEDTGFPLDVFPQSVQSIILDMAKYENYKIEFIATSMLSAVSAALGGTYRIRIKGDWQSNGALYVILVGRPGLGKTPPLEAAYRPIRKHDYALFKAYEAEMEAWKAAGENGRKPVLKRTIISDFTPESLLLTHNNNPRSVVILVDEIMGMFNSANRYTNGQLIEQLLTAWSGGALDVTRVSNTIPVHIEHPCINIIGGTQTKRVHELLRKGFEENGLLDRILFVLPKSSRMSEWVNRDDDGEKMSATATRWENILDKVLALDYDTEAEERIPHVLSMDREAKEYFFSWWNSKVERINKIEDDAEVDSREMKHPAHVARLALLMQVLRHASGESHLQFVDMVSVKAAIRLNDYFENSYVRIRSFVANDTCEDPPKVLLSMLPDTFDTKTAIAIGKEQQGVSERTVMNYLKELCHSRLLRKAKAGHYEKVMYESGKSSTHEYE
ncbi:DUF3987 domain-containing protein [Phocaeicola dorei]|uniref:DUF3987 domain-containing protein n=2 Tax=Phocaeicola dorei TaxID=357276 RepID=B6VVV0_9BACT|nr:DUF3987 domain-containing protein [Phocaeicola dorei]EEB26087.1 hypothetical protein BACDOR_01408 [Phocaeicola dorei DSM 17855]QJR77372.1 DUF3987 domain-containing protein [Phocaeicola dorei]UWN82150.1 YfjI family protein [Phocaeicola dorei]